jgi:hypothetical protein
LHTQCGQYLFKTLRGEEPDNIRAFLAEYKEYIISQPNSLLPRYLGLFSIERMNYLDGSSTWFETKTVFLLMRNWFDSDLLPVLKFDFKGSSVGRKSLDVMQTNNEQTLKEMDFMYLQSQGLVNFIALNPDMRQQIIQQLQRDVSVLQSNMFMDYRY